MTRTAKSSRQNAASPAPETSDGTASQALAVSPLANPGWEAFARFLQQGLAPSEAYRQAGYRAHASRAKSLAVHPLVMERVAQLRDQSSRSLQSQHRIRAEALYQQALESGNLSVAAQVLRQLSGLIDPDQSPTAPLLDATQLATVETLSDDQLESELERALAEIGRAAARPGNRPTPAPAPQ